MFCTVEQFGVSSLTLLKQSCMLCGCEHLKKALFVCIDRMSKQSGVGISKGRKRCDLVNASYL